MRRNLSRLTRIEIEHVEAHANFTETEEAVFRLLCRDKSSVQIQMTLHKEHGEPPAPMMAVYEYMHKRHIEKAAKIKTYQTQYRDRM